MEEKFESDIEDKNRPPVEISRRAICVSAVTSVALILGCLAGTAFSGHPQSNEIKVGNYISLEDSGIQGFVQYIDQMEGYELIALSTDIGSAVPSNDHRLYVKLNDRYKKVLSIPLLSRKGFLCIKQNDTLQVFVITSYNTKQPPEDATPVLEINLKQLLRMVEPKP